MSESSDLPIATQIAGTTTFAFIYNDAVIYGSDRRATLRRAGDADNIFVIGSDNTRKIVNLTSHISVTISGNFVRGMTIVNYLQETIAQSVDLQTIDNIAQLTSNYMKNVPPMYPFSLYTDPPNKSPRWTTLLIVGIDEYMKPRIERLEDKKFNNDVPTWNETPRAFEGSGQFAAIRMCGQLTEENMDVKAAVEYAQKIILSGCLNDGDSGGAIDVSFRSKKEQVDVVTKVDELFLYYYSLFTDPRYISIFVLHSYRRRPVGNGFIDSVNNLEIGSLFSSLPYQVRVNRLSIVRERFVLKRVTVETGGHPFDIRAHFGNYIKENPSRDPIIRNFVCMEYPCEFPNEQPRLLTLYLVEESRATLEELIQ